MFVGMDLHMQIAVMNDEGKVLENSRIKNNLKQVGILLVHVLLTEQQDFSDKL
jgi:hypothetical protein